MKKKLLAALLGATVLCAAIGLAACGEKPDPPIDDDPPSVVLKDENVRAEIDIYSITYVAIDIPSLFTEVPDGVSYTATSNSEHITVSSVSTAGRVNVISDGTVGDYTITIAVNLNGESLKSFNVTIQVVDKAPVPTVTKEIEDIALDAPVFPTSEKTYYEYTIDLSQHFEAASNVTYQASCEDGTVTLTADEAKPYLVTLTFTDFGEQNVTVSAVQNGEVKASSTFKATLTEATPNQLINGDIELGYTGWNMDEWARAAYSVYDSPVDIWGNGVDNNGAYLYGYYNESGTCEFTSSLFTVGGSGMITWKMAGNCTENLQFILMKHNEQGEDVEIAKFNNWYYGTYAGSGFIFREYYYQIPAEYQGSACYFKVVDNAVNEATGFSFICLDSIVTYYEQAPDVSELYKAWYIVDPSGVELDMSDTSQVPFPEDLSTVPQQLVNGGFESGYTGWYMTAEEKAAYAIFGSKTDIWNNPVNATNNYLYGYKNEAFAAANFHSSLFKVGGSGMITWKMAGNNSETLQFVLMKYNPDGEDVEVAKFNNWYFPISNESGFIFRNYYYQIDMAEYEGSYMYFVVKDYANSNFAFICLDDIVTYYAEAPTLGEGWFKAGFVNNPDA